MDSFYFSDQDMAIDLLNNYICEIEAEMRDTRKDTFKDLSCVAWTANEIRDRIKLNPIVSPVEVASEFAAEMYMYSDKNDIFGLATDTALQISSIFDGLM